MDGITPETRARRGILTEAGNIACAFAQAPGRYLAVISLMDPVLAASIARLADDVFDLDYRAAFLGPPPSSPRNLPPDAVAYSSTP